MKKNRNQKQNNANNNDDVDDDDDDDDGDDANFRPWRFSHPVLLMEENQFWGYLDVMD